jgi:undecaprenyl-diphosphatase
VFKLLWPLGTTPFTLLALLILTILEYKSGLLAIGLFCLVVSFEWLLKKSEKRPRPFSFLHNVKVLQPRQPKDPSFPSGDSLRVWYISLVLPIAFGLALPFRIIVLILAALVTLGRSVLGVHFPTDAIAGAGLGILTAGVWVILKSII